MSSKSIDLSLLKEVASELSQKLMPYQYAIRGTASVVLHGFDMICDDIDIICDSSTALKCNEIFSESMADMIMYREGAKFKSYFGKFYYKELPVEIMGDWQILNSKGEWSRMYNGSEYEIIDGVRCTPMKLELEAFMLMGRWNAYHKLKNQLTPHTINDNNQLKLI